MAAGLGFKTFTTGEVLTAADVNGYLMQGILVFANAAARSSAITSPQEGQYSFLKDTNALEYYDGAAWVGAPVGDITAVNAGTGITGGGASGSVTITNDMATTITAAGDIVVGTGSGTYDNLPIGTTGQVLTADTTVSPYKVKWAAAAGGAGNMVQIATGTLSGASVTISSLSSYDNLFLTLTGYTNSTANGYPSVRINNNSGATNYNHFNVYYDATSFQPYDNKLDAIYLTTDPIERTNTAQIAAATLTNCKSTGFTNWDSNCRAYTGANKAHFIKGVYTVSEAVSSLVIFNSGGNWAGGTYTLWGA